MSYARHIENSVLPYEPADRRVLREFQREYFGPNSRQCSEPFCDWLFERNPHRAPGAPVQWICKRDGIVVGQQASIPVRLKAGDREYRASWGIDLMVRSEWRLRGITPLLAGAYERSAGILFGLGISDAAYRAFMRGGWTDMGRLQLMVRPLDAQACAEAVGNHQWLARRAPQQLVQGSARMMAAIATATRRCTLELAPAFDERADSIWAASAGDYPVLVKRDLQSLRWRFDQFPGQPAYQRYFLMHRSQPVGYAVVRTDSWRGHPVARVVDYLGKRRWLRPLLALVIDAMRQKGIAAVFFEQLYADAAAVLRPLGCVHVNAVTRFILKVQPEAAAASGLVEQPLSWLAMRSDSDSDFPPVLADDEDGSLGVSQDLGCLAAK